MRGVAGLPAQSAVIDGRSSCAVVHVAVPDVLAEDDDVEPSPATSQTPDTDPVVFVASSNHGGVDGGMLGIASVPLASLPSAATGKLHRLIASQRYFGLSARVFHAGGQRTLERLSAQKHGAEQIDLESLGHDFTLDPAEALRLLRAMLSGGLLLPDAAGHYRPTARFREYATAPLVAPLSRARAKALVAGACDLAAQINAGWARNPFEVKMVAVSGGYMSRSDQLSELSLWLVLRPRAAGHSRRWRPLLTKGAGLRQILTAVSALSSFVVARIVAHKSVVPRPFSIVFDGAELVDAAVSPAQRLRDWGTSLGELISGSYVPGRRGRRR
jgi:hypothetical protein